LANDKILVVGNWYVSTSTPELYNPGTNTFTAAGAMVTPRSHPMVLPTNDGNAFVFGGYDLYGGSMVNSVEEYDVATNSFSQVASSLLPTQTGWIAAWYPNMGSMHDNRLSDGKYIFLIYRPSGGTNEYRLMTFDPATKMFDVLTTSPQIPDYNSAGPGDWAYPFNIVVDSYMDYVYIDMVNLNSGNNEHKLMTVDISSGELAIPITSTTHNHLMYTATKVMIPGGEIAYTGGTIDGGNFNVSDDYTLIEPLPSFGITELPENEGWFYAYPNPASGSKFYLNLPEVEVNAIRIVDLTGKLVKEIDVSGNSIKNLAVNRGDLHSGIYLVVLEYEGGSSVTRLILK